MQRLRLQGSFDTGLAPSPERFSSALAATIRPVVDGVPGLYLTGQDLTIAGWSGALQAALLTCRAALGYTWWDVAVKGRDVVLDLRNAMAAEAETAHLWQARAEREQVRAAVQAEAAAEAAAKKAEAAKKKRR